MIEEIHVRSVATYDIEGQSLNNLRAVNFLYGANGSGKTTISRALANASKDPKYKDCQIKWAGMMPIDCLVYNQDFVEENLQSQIPGIFTLGTEDASLLKLVASTKQKCDEIAQDIRQLRHTLSGNDGNGGKKAELNKLLEENDTYFWTFKTRYDAEFQEAFRGLRNSKVAFRERLLEEAKSNTAKLFSRDELKNRARTVYSQAPVKLPLIQQADLTIVSKHERSRVLNKVVIGREDVDIAALIQKLGNADWVKEGKKYFDHNPGTCPFCQQSTDHSFAKSLHDYFDQQYLDDIAEIDAVSSEYEHASNKVVGYLDALVEQRPSYLDIDALSVSSERLKTIFLSNGDKLRTKRKEPSRVVELESVSDLVNEIADLIERTNAAISAHNDQIDNLQLERKALTDQVWRLIIDEAKAGLDQFQKARAGIEKAIAGLENGIAKKDAELVQTRKELVQLEAKITSVQPTADAINNILNSFGFNNFRLTVRDDNPNCYQLVRSNGDVVGTTLSEGERTFIAFLYFYYMVRGGTSAGSVKSNRVVVIDDPISSLDSEVLFVVSSLVKQLVAECRTEQNYIKQIFILTHNIYFHKEASFDPKRSGGCLKDESFWIIRKNRRSEIIRYDHNPIKTSYELLWSEIKEKNRSNNLTTQNVLRRILEYYFTILGNRDKDSIIECFEGEEKIICRSLFTWINEGSHFAGDELFISADENTTERYLSVFRRIFEKTNQEAHYHMMMGTNTEEQISIAPTANGQPIKLEGIDVGRVSSVEPTLLLGSQAQPGAGVADASGKAPP